MRRQGAPDLRTWQRGPQVTVDTRCDRCGAPLSAQVGRGRRRKRCASCAVPARSLTRDQREGRAALAALMLDTYLSAARHPDRELLLRGRSALDEAIGTTAALRAPSGRRT